MNVSKYPCSGTFSFYPMECSEIVTFNLSKGWGVTALYPFAQFLKSILGSKSFVAYSPVLALPSGTLLPKNFCSREWFKKIKEQLNDKILGPLL